MVDVLFIIILVLFSAICSGLNISLMALDVSDLKRKAKLGNHYARLVLPLRKNAHLTLASLLLVNVAGVSATSLVLEQHFNGLIAGALTTLLIVIFAEITPQVIFSKRPLLWTGRFTYLLQAMVAITYPLSKPIQLLLSHVVGHSPKRFQSRHELGLMISEYLGPETSELDEDEVEIIRGALQLSEKQVSRITTPISKTFWLTPETVLDTATFHELRNHGYSRVPIFNRSLTSCYGVLLLKDLVAEIPGDQPRPIADYKLYPVEPIGSRTALDTMFRTFIHSHTHLIPVERKGKIIGIATIEDLIEEILGHEIKDETDRQKHRQ